MTKGKKLSPKPGCSKTPDEPTEPSMEQSAGNVPRIYIDAVSRLRPHEISEQSIRDFALKRFNVDITNQVHGSQIWTRSFVQKLSESISSENTKTKISKRGRSSSLHGKTSKKSKDNFRGSKLKMGPVETGDHENLEDTTTSGKRMSKVMKIKNPMNQPTAILIPRQPDDVGTTDIGETKKTVANNKKVSGKRIVKKSATKDLVPKASSGVVLTNPKKVSTSTSKIKISSCTKQNEPRMMNQMDKFAGASNVSADVKEKKTEKPEIASKNKSLKVSSRLQTKPILTERASQTEPALTALSKVKDGCSATADTGEKFQAKDGLKITSLKTKTPKQTGEILNPIAPSEDSRRTKKTGKVKKSHLEKRATKSKDPKKKTVAKKVVKNAQKTGKPKKFPKKKYQL